MNLSRRESQISSKAFRAAFAEKVWERLPSIDFVPDVLKDSGCAAWEAVLQEKVEDRQSLDPDSSRMFLLALGLERFLNFDGWWFAERGGEFFRAETLERIRAARGTARTVALDGDSYFDVSSNSLDLQAAAMRAQQVNRLFRSIAAEELRGVDLHSGDWALNLRALFLGCGYSTSSVKEGGLRYGRSDADGFEVLFTIDVNEPPGLWIKCSIKLTCQAISSRPSVPLNFGVLVPGLLNYTSPSWLRSPVLSAVSDVEGPASPARHADEVIVLAAPDKTGVDRNRLLAGACLAAKAYLAVLEAIRPMMKEAANEACLPRASGLG
jgi:hypothetical protein